MKRLALILGLLVSLLIPSTSPRLEASERITPLPSGTLLFLQNGNKIVRSFTNSGFSHVAILIRDSQQAWVYEATPAKVRRMPLSDYYEDIARLNSKRKPKRQIRVWLMSPKWHYTAPTVTKMKTFLDQQLGRRYSVKGIVRGKKGDGIHCSQLASQTLGLASALDFSKCHLITPGELMNEVGTHYPTRRMAKLPTFVDQRTWCSKAWDGVKGCFDWCGWSCRESWSWLH